MVTAELAIGMTTLVIVVLVGVWMLHLMVLQVRCIDAARDTARAVARGETAEVARMEGRRSAPEDASIVIERDADWVEVTVAVAARAPWPALSGWPAVPIEGVAAVAVEPRYDPLPDYDLLPDDLLPDDPLPIGRDR